MHEAHFHRIQKISSNQVKLVQILYHHRECSISDSMGTARIWSSKRGAFLFANGWDDNEKHASQVSCIHDKRYQ